MKTITIYEPNDVVYFLSISRGFVQGTIKTVYFNNSLNEISYKVTCKHYNKEYVGDDITHNLLFKTSDDMFEYYKNMFNKQFNS
jgi:hypothetical protein